MNQLVKYAIDAAKAVGACKKGDKVVCIMGLSEENVHDILTTKIVEWIKIFMIMLLLENINIIIKWIN